ncbi:unnamed protein product, partial [Aphanomyces euteiches]
KKGGKGKPQLESAPQTSPAEDERLQALYAQAMAAYGTQRRLYVEQQERQTMLAADVESVMVEQQQSWPSPQGATKVEFRHRLLTALHLGVACDSSPSRCRRSSPSSLGWGFQGATLLSATVACVTSLHDTTDAIVNACGRWIVQWKEIGVWTPTGQAPPSSLSSYEQQDIRRLKANEATTWTPSSLPVDTVVTRAMTLALLHGLVPSTSMAMALAVAKTAHEETQDVVRYLVMLVLGILQGVNKTKLLVPFFVARAFPEDYWIKQPVAAPVRRVVERLPATRFDDKRIDYMANAHAVTTLEMALAMFQAADSRADGCERVAEVAHPHSAVGSTVGILLGAYYPEPNLDTLPRLHLSEMVLTLFRHGYVFALRRRASTVSSSCITSSFQTAWTLYLHGANRLTAVLAKVDQTIQAVDPRKLGAALEPLYNTLDDLRVDMADFHEAYRQLESSLVPPPPIPLAPPIEPTLSSAVNTTESPTKQSKETTPQRTTASRTSSRRSAVKPPKKTPQDAPTSAKMLLQRTLSDRYGSLRASVKTHFESLLDGLATELDGALRRDHAIEAWAIRADVAAALASNQDNLGAIQENLASGHVNLSNKALMASLS